MRNLISISVVAVALLLAGEGVHAGCGDFGSCSSCSAANCYWCEIGNGFCSDSPRGDECHSGGCITPPTPPSTAPAPVTCPFPSSSRASHQWVANQIYQGNVSPYTWWISACGDTVPSTLGQCSGAAQGYLAQYSNNGGCENEWDTIAQQWVKHRSGFFDAYTAKFSSSVGGANAKVTIVCNGQEDSIQHVGDVDVITTSSGANSYVFNLKTSPAGCKAVTAAPTETPEPTAPNGCSSHQSCAGCTQASSGLCGWCVQTKTCSQGTSTGPNAPTTCPAGDWRWYFSSC